MGDSENRPEQRPIVGRFVKGQSGNPGGRPKGDAWFRGLCRKRTVKALKALEAALLREDHAVSAAKALLEFGWGKAPAVLNVSGSLDTNPAEPLTTEQLLALAAAVKP